MIRPMIRYAIFWCNYPYVMIHKVECAFYQRIRSSRAGRGRAEFDSVATAESAAHQRAAEIGVELGTKVPVKNCQHYIRTIQ
jgi:hypothetical protein